MKTIAERTRQTRIKRRMTQENLAIKSGVSQGVISDLETGKAKGTTYLATIARALKVNAIWYQTGEGKEDIDYVSLQEIAKNYPSEIQEALAIILSADDRGRKKMVLALKDVADQHRAVLDSTKDSQSAAFANRLGQEILTKILENQKNLSEAYKSEEAAKVPKHKRH